MKKSNFSFFGKFLVIFLLIGGIVASCSKSEGDDDFALEEAQEVFEEDYFTIRDSQFVPGPLPRANSTDLEIYSISGNATVIAGGSNLITIEASSNARSVVAGILDENGYFVVPIMASSGDNTSTVVDLQMLISRQSAESYVIALSVTDDEDNYSEYEYIEVDLQEAGIGELQISLTWDQLNDVDLHLIQPDGQHIYYGSRYSSNGGWLDLDSNPACSIDEVNNENIFYGDEEGITIQNGVYEVLVDLWANCNIEGQTNYGIVAYYGDVMLTPIEGENPHYGYLTQDDESHNTNLISVMKFEITGETDIDDNDEDGDDIGEGAGQRAYNALAPMNDRRVANFRYDKNNKVFKSYNVKE